MYTEDILRIPRECSSKEVFMKRLSSVLVATVLALCAMPALASNHTGIDQWGHFTFHVQQMVFWLGQGQWSLAFYQADCTLDPLSKLLFVHGGALWLSVGLLAAAMYFARKRLAQAFHRATWFMRFRPRFA